MSSQSMNPLAKHFRQPAIHLSLPSKGQYWPQGSLDLNMSGQLEIYPMTTKDEITIRTPDALLNGSSIVSLFQSCCPQIKDAWKTPNIDVDAILIGIRIATYGQNMDLNTICPNPECKNDNKHELDLTVILDGLTCPNYNRTVEVNGLKVKLKPLTYFENNKSKMLTFEQDRALSVIGDESIADDKKIEAFNQHLSNMVDINNGLITAGTEYIETSDGTQVSDSTFISEFYNNCDTKIVKAIKERFEEFAKTTELPKPRISCEECHTEYPVVVGFDYANFFVNAS